MKFSSRWLGVSTAALMLAAGVVTIHFVARAGEPTPGIHVDNTPLNRDPQSGNSYSPVVKKVAPSVVNIYSSRIVKQRLYRNPLLADPFFRQFFGEAEGGSREITSRDNWLGSGMIVSPDGYILTANHVVEGADEIKVGIQNDKTVYSAKVIGLDQPTDVAILKIEAKNLPAVTPGRQRPTRSGRRGARHRQSLRHRPNRHPRHHQRAGTQHHRSPATTPLIRASTRISSRRTPPSTRAIPAARWWMPKAGSSASTTP